MRAHAALRSSVSARRFATLPVELRHAPLLVDALPDEGESEAVDGDVAVPYAPTLHGEAASLVGTDKPPPPPPPYRDVASALIRGVCVCGDVLRRPAKLHGRTSVRRGGCRVEIWTKRAADPRIPAQNPPGKIADFEPNVGVTMPKKRFPAFRAAPRLGGSAGVRIA